MRERLHCTDRDWAAHVRSDSAGNLDCLCLLGLAVILVMGKAGWITTGPLPVALDIGVWGLSLGFSLAGGGEPAVVWVLQDHSRHALRRVGHLVVFAVAPAVGASRCRIGEVAARAVRTPFVDRDKTGES
jgi:hypothetical protein